MRSLSWVGRWLANTTNRCGAWSAALLVSAAFAVPVTAQVVLPDGGTATGFVLGTDGKITVDLAPAGPNGTSYNSYTRFSVPVEGVDLDNTLAGAGTIINEVTSANPTVISGALTVIGPQGHVIIANPNGITVNGGRFVTTGNVALTTGAMGVDGAGRPVSTVAGGEIVVGENGLSGTMAGLDLIAKSIRLNGGVRFDFGTAPGAISLTAGSTTVGFDATRAAGGILPWALASGGGAVPGEVLVDITRNASLEAGRISVLVSDAGAGVRMAGDHLVGAGGFNLSADGALTLAGPSLAATGSVNILAGSVDHTDGEVIDIASSDSGVTIEAMDGDIDLGLARITGDRIASDNLASSGGVTLIAAGSIKAGAQGERSSLTSGSSHTAAFAGEGLDFNSVDFHAAGGLRFTAGSDVGFSDVIGTAGQDFLVLAGGALSFDATDIEAQSSVQLEGTNLRFGSEDASQTRTEIVSVASGLTARALDGNLVNNGSLLQGAFRIPGAADSFGGASLYATGDIINRSLSPSRLAVAFGRVHDLYLQAGGSIRNLSGRLFSNAGITLNATGDVINQTVLTEGDGEFAVSNGHGGRFIESLFFLRSRVTTANADYGDLAVEGERALILGIGTILINAANITNDGGEITSIDVTLAALSKVENSARLAGELTYRRVCRLFCSTSGSSTLQSVGGILNASGRLLVIAGDKITSTAGQLIGNTGVTLTAPLTEFAPAPSFTFIERPGGLLTLFRDRFVWFTAANDFGSIAVRTGTITINGNAILGDVRIAAAADPVVSGSIIESDAADFVFTTLRGPIGLFWALF